MYNVSINQFLIMLVEKGSGLKIQIGCDVNLLNVGSKLQEEFSSKGDLRNFKLSVIKCFLHTHLKTIHIKKTKNRPNFKIRC